LGNIGRIIMNSKYPRMFPRLAGVITLLAATGTLHATTTVNLTAQRSNITLPDGATVPMWRFCGGLDGTSTNSGSTSGGSCTAAAGWTPGPTIIVPVGDPSLTINLNNQLPVPTSIVVLGQIGGGLGTPTRMSSNPVHNTQTQATFPGVGAADPPFTPPPQPVARVESFATQVPAPGTATLTWENLKPGTYIYETGTLPSLEEHRIPWCQVRLRRRYAVQ
jgi:hypothetical protein